MADSVESAKFQPRVNNIATVQSVTAAAGLPDSRTIQPVTHAIVDGEEHAVFRFLSRNMKKQTTSARALYIPADIEMVTSTQANQAEAIREKEEQKRLVLKGLERTEREQADEDRLTQAERQRADRQAGVVQDFSHRQMTPTGMPASSSSSSSSSTDKYSLNRIGALMGRQQKKDDLSLNIDDLNFAFAGPETLTQSRVTLQGGDRRKR